MLQMGPIKFLYNSKFDLTAKLLVTNTVVITRILCTCFLDSDPVAHNTVKFTTVHKSGLYLMKKENEKQNALLLISFSFKRFKMKHFCCSQRSNIVTEKHLLEN